MGLEKIHGLQPNIKVLLYTSTLYTPGSCIFKFSSCPWCLLRSDPFLTILITPLRGIIIVAMPGLYGASSPISSPPPLVSLVKKNRKPCAGERPSWAIKHLPVLRAWYTISLSVTKSPARGEKVSMCVLMVPRRNRYERGVNLKGPSFTEDP